MFSVRIVNQRGRKKSYFQLLMILPAVLVLISLVIFPLLYTLVLSFHKWSISSVTSPKFIGVENFLKMLADNHLRHSLKVTAYFTFVSLAIEVSLGVLLAQFLSPSFRGKSFIRAILVLPMASTPVAISLVWRLMYHPTLGILNYFLSVLGFGSRAWLTQRSTVIPALIIVDCWQWIPLVALIAMAGMSTIDKSLYEVGAIDGASKWQLFVHITLPLIRPSIVVATMLRFMDSLKTFDTVYVLTEGGPGTASRILNLYIFDTTFRYFRMGYGCALIVFMSSLIVLMSLFMIKIRRGA